MNTFLGYFSCKPIVCPKGFLFESYVSSYIDSYSKPPCSFDTYFTVVAVAERRAGITKGGQVQLVPDCAAITRPRVDWHFSRGFALKC